MNDMKKMQKARAEALEAAVKAVLSGVEKSGATSSTIEPEEVLTYAEFILGKRPAEKKRRKARPDATGHLNIRDGRAYWAPAGEPLPNPWETSTPPEPDATSSQPVGEDPGDRGILTQWAEAIRQQDAAREAAREARDLEVDPEEERFATSRAVTWAPQRHEPETSEKAPDHVVAQGASLGCPECSAEAERRQERDARLKEGRAKLARRLQVLRPNGPLDEDELLAVAGSEVYPPNDEEPSRDLKIRNRKGEVRTWRSGGAQEGHGWTASPEDPWGLRYAWTSLEMSRRGPWHVV